MKSTLGSIRLAYFTSFREIIFDEQVSRNVVDPDTGKEYGYRCGNLEDMALMLANPEKHTHPLAGEFAGTFELAMVFSDDPFDKLQATREAVQKWPLDVNVPNGTGNVLLEDLLVNIPSAPWRRISEPLIKIIKKSEYEMEIEAELRKRAVDLVLSDSYLTLFGPVLLETYGLRILNIHPAITAKDDPNRLPGVTPTRDAYTRARHGYIIVDDKRNRDTWPLGNPVEVEFESEPRQAIYVLKTNMTGVTVHVVTEEIDGGPVVKHVKHRFPFESTREEIRDRNYNGKRALLPAAMLEYAKRPDIMELIIKKRAEARTRG